jgi:hypothetical protein
LAPQTFPAQRRFDALSFESLVSDTVSCTLLLSLLSGADEHRSVHPFRKEMLGKL